LHREPPWSAIRSGGDAGSDEDALAGFVWRIISSTRLFQSGRMMRQSAIRCGGDAGSDEDALASFVWRIVSSTRLFQSGR